MHIVLFGASGMIGQGVLRECLLAEDVSYVLSVCRRPSGQSHAKLREVVHGHFTDFSSIENELAGIDACFFCLGTTSAGMKEADYKRVTYDIPLAAAHALLKVNARLTFIYISGAGADSSEKGRIMWARVKGAAENALLRLPFACVCAFRPAVVVPLHGIQSRTAMYRVLYKVMGPVLPLLSRYAPKYTTATERIGQAMLKIARTGVAPMPVLENADINQV